MDIVVDLEWYQASGGKLGPVGGRSKQKLSNPDLEAEVLVYGDEYKVHHLRVLLDTDDQEVASAALNAKVQQWNDALGVASALATPAISSAASLQKNSASFMVLMFEGGETADGLALELKYRPPSPANLPAAAKLMAAWKADYVVHLHYFARFLNHDAPPEYRWLSGYRLIEWHFMRGKDGLSKDKAFRDWISVEGSALDELLKTNQTRHGLLEEARAFAAHALLADTSDPRSNNGSTDILLRSFRALEGLVCNIMNDGLVDGVTIFQPPASNPPLKI